MSVDIQLLGTPALTRDGRPLHLHSAKTLALMAYLALETDRDHSREKLASLLWGGSPDANARQSLRQALYSLRRTLPDGSIAADRETATFVPTPEVWVDALAFEERATRSADAGDLNALREAANLYRGMLLEGVQPSDSPAFEEWLFFKRDRLEQMALSALQRLIDGLLDRGEYRAALDPARRLVTLDPLHEGAYRRLMRIHGGLDDRNAVRHQYELCEAVMARELGVEPDAETQSLYQALMADRPLPPRPTRASPVPRHVEPDAYVLPFLGRERELAVLNAHFDRTAEGQGQMVLVSGEVGVGKTRLVETFLRDAVRRSPRPVLTLQARCYAAESSAPYAMWADALQVLATDRGRPYLADLPQVWRMQLARLVPDLGSPARDMQGATDAESRLRLLQGVARTLAHAAGAGVLCLWFDDLHWADEASLATLHYVARHLINQRVLIIGAHHPDAPDDAPSFQALLAGIPHAATLALSPLAPEVVAPMLRRLGYQGETELARRLYRHSEGNPLFLTETIQTLIESGELDAEQAGRAVPADVEAWPVPARIQRVIRRRTDSLPETARRVLAAGAVIGRPFGPVLVRRVSGMPEPDVVDAVDQALRRGFLDERSGAGPDASLAFHHSYIRRVIDEDLSAIQRQALHRRAGEILLALHQARPQAVIEEVARHFEQAGDPRAVAYLVEAAERAGALYAYGNATAYLTRALARLDTTHPDDRARRFDLLLEREALLDRQGRRAEQARDVTALKRLAEDLDDPKRRALALVREAGLLSTTGDYDGARSAGERALARYRTADDGAGEGQALRELGFTAWSAGDYRAALGYMRDALTLHRRLGNVEGEATALHNLAEIHRSLGSPRQALGEYETALNLYWARQMRERQALTLYGMAHALREMDEREEALRRYRETLDHCEAVGDRLMASRVHHALANLHRDLAHPDAAIDHMAQAVAISREIGYGPGIAHGLVTLSALEAQNGRPEAAEQHLAEARTWLSLTEAEAEGAAAFPPNAAAPDLPIRAGWVKSHVTLPEGKVYCAFESPMARDVLAPPRLSDDLTHNERPDATP